MKSITLTPFLLLSLMTIIYHAIYKLLTPGGINEILIWSLFVLTLYSPLLYIERKLIKKQSFKKVCAIEALLICMFILGFLLYKLRII